jgi:hypothetical protein
MTLLLIGEAPGRGDGPALGPGGSTGRRLTELFGRDDYLSVVRAVNLFDPRPERWSRRDARRRAVWLLMNREEERFVLFGRQVARAFNADEVPLFTWARAFKPLAVLPHPSGRCQAWNDPETVAKARTFLADAIERW